MLTLVVTVCPWRHTHIVPLRRQRLQLLISYIMLLTAGTSRVHLITATAVPQSQATLLSPPRVNRLCSDNMGRHYFQRLGRRMRLLPPRPLADRREHIVACCQLHILLRASHHILPLDHRCSDA
jgi:hypothetical protein